MQEYNSLSELFSYENISLSNRYNTETTIFSNCVLKKTFVHFPIGTKFNTISYNTGCVMFLILKVQLSRARTA